VCGVHGVVPVFVFFCREHLTPHPLRVPTTTTPPLPATHLPPTHRYVKSFFCTAFDLFFYFFRCSDLDRRATTHGPSPLLCMKPETRKQQEKRRCPVQQKGNSLSTTLLALLMRCVSSCEDWRWHGGVCCTLEVPFAASPRAERPGEKKKRMNGAHVHAMHSLDIPPSSLPFSSVNIKKKTLSHITAVCACVSVMLLYRGNTNEHW
jgi:hypothetical protein